MESSCVIGNELRVFCRAQRGSVRSNITVKREINNLMALNVKIIASQKTKKKGEIEGGGVEGAGRREVRGNVRKVHKQNAQ